jgi:hypothetical protein
MCSVLSNHQAPSRDIAIKFADLDRVKHLLCGGYWLDNSVRRSAGPSVSSLLFQTPILQRHLGWTPEREWKACTIKYPPKPKKRPLPSLKTSQTALNKADRSALSEDVECTTTWLLAPYVTSVTGDECQEGSWCAFSVGRNNNDPDTMVDNHLL